MKTMTLTKTAKSLLALGPLVLGLSAFAPDSSYAYDSYDYECLPPYAAYPTCDYPYGYYDGLGFWWSRDDHRHFDHHHFDHGDHGHGGYGHGGGGHGGGGHGH